MSTNSSKNELGIFVRNGIPVVSSRDVAKMFNKEHKNVLRDIDNLDCSPDFTRLNFEQCTYHNRKNVSQREYLMTKDGLVFLVMGFSGKEAATFKERYIGAFNYMAESLRTRGALKTSYWPMMEAVKDAHEDPQFYHYSNENNLIYRIMFGMDAKHYREKLGLTENDDIRDHIKNEEKKIMLNLQEANTGLLRIEMDYKERKERLTNLFLKCQNKLQNKALLC